MHGKDRVTGITIAQVDSSWKVIKGTEKFFSCDTLLLSVGLIPENEVSKKAGISLAKTGGPEVNQFLQTSIKGIFACGNVLQVHDLVDNVSIEAKRAGRMAALYIQGIEFPGLADGDAVHVVPRTGIGYVLPHVINTTNGDGNPVKLSLRVRVPMKNVYLCIKNGSQVLYKKFFKYVRPSEMNILEIKNEENKFLNAIDTSTTIDVFVEFKEESDHE